MEWLSKITSRAARRLNRPKASAKLHNPLHITKLFDDRAIFTCLIFKVIIRFCEATKKVRHSNLLATVPDLILAIL